MRVVVLFALLLAAMFSPVPLAGPAMAKTDCSVAGVQFVTCVPSARHFKSIVVAIPGWNGVCKDSFGVGDSNILNVMREASFFDVECFDYDSHHTKLDVTVGQLRELLLHIQDLGYQEVSFVTHSTGGIVALQLLLQELEAGDGSTIKNGADRSFLFKARGGFRVKAVYAWGTPINGVRDHVCKAGELANLFDFSPDVLPNLCADAPFLKDLKERYAKLSALMKLLPASEQKSFSFDLLLFQGMGDDWVVNNIEEYEPWFPSFARVKPVRTNDPHTKVIIDNGTIKFPTFSGLTMTDRAQLTFSLLPRTDEFFRADAAASGDLNAGQRAIVDGVVDFSELGNLFLAGATEVSGFTVRLFNGRFVRDPGFDEFAVDRFDLLLREKIDTLKDQDAVRYGDALLSDIETGYVAPNAADAQMFGGQSKDAVRKLEETVGFVFDSVGGLVRSDNALESDLIVSKKLPVFEGKVAKVLERLLADTDVQTKQAAVETLGKFVTNASADGVAALDFNATFAAYARANYNIASAKEKSAFADAISAYSARAPETQARTLDLLTETRPYLGIETPLWAPYFTEKQLERFITKGDRSQVESRWPVFLGQVIENAGRYNGQSFEIGNQAIEAYQPYLTLDDQGLRKNYQARFVNGLTRTDYPAVQANGIEMLNNLGIESSQVMLSGPGQ